MQWNVAVVHQSYFKCNYFIIISSSPPLNVRISSSPPLSKWETFVLSVGSMNLIKFPSDIHSIVKCLKLNVWCPHLTRVCWCPIHMNGITLIGNLRSNRGLITWLLLVGPSWKTHREDLMRKSIFAFFLDTLSGVNINPEKSIYNDLVFCYNLISFVMIKQWNYFLGDHNLLNGRPESKPKTKPFCLSSVYQACFYSHFKHQLCIHFYARTLVKTIFTHAPCSSVGQQTDFFSSFFPLPTFCFC